MIEAREMKASRQARNGGRLPLGSGGARWGGWARGGQAGFSIAELLTTVSIFMGLGLFSQPVFSEIMNMYKLHGATRQVYAEMQKTRMTAIMENTRCRARRDSGTLQFERCKEQPCTSQACKASDSWAPISDQELNAKDLAGLNLSGPDCILFAPNGSAIGADSWTITDAEGNSKVIAISPAGSIRVN